MSPSTLYGHQGDPVERALFGTYFERLYAACDLDREHIRDALKVDGGTLAVNFRTAADKFRLIQDEDTAPVIVLYGGPDGTDDTAAVLLGRLRKDGPERWLMRKLQRYTVNVHRHEALRLLGQRDIEEVIPGLFAQVGDCLYDPVLGLLTDETPIAPASLIA